MQIFFSKHKSFAALLLGAALLSGGTVFASAVNYSGVLPSWQQATTLCNGTRSSQDLNAANTVRTMGGSYRKMAAWIDRGYGNQLTDRVLCYEGSTTTIPYQTSPSVGSTLQARACCGDLNPVNVAVTGTFDFK